MYRTITVLGFWFLVTTAAHAQGIILPASGPVHRGMAGASVAAPMDALGALYWNPASISGIEDSQVSTGFGLLLSDYEVSSSISGLASGTTGTEPGVSPIPNVGFVHQTQYEDIKLGLGLQSTAGYYANTPTDPANPVLSAPPNGFGRFWSQAIFLQMAPVASYQLTDRLAVGGGPILGLGNIATNINFLVAPNTSGTYPTGDGTRYAWGGGFQLGVPLKIATFQRRT